MSTLDERIDDLYRLPLAEFVAARTALARSLKGADAARVRALPKPTVVPWAINQLYWSEHDLFGRLRKNGDTLRSTQVAVLKGKTADVRAAAAEHRTVLGEAVRATIKLAAAHGTHVAADAVSRSLEALSLARDWPEPPGRLTKPVQPGGFGALAGITPAAAALKVVVPTSRAPEPKPAAKRAPSDASARAAAREAAKAREQRAADERRARAERDRAAQRARAKQKAVAAAERRLREASAAAGRAEAALARARSAESLAREQLEKTRG